MVSGLHFYSAYERHLQPGVGPAGGCAGRTAFVVLFTRIGICASNTIFILFR
jgi:hypothetical protein